MTENAYVRGYVTIMSPQLSGYVADVPVHDYETVKAGQLLVKIDDRIYAQKLAQAEATLAGQKAALANSYQQELSAKAGIAASQAQPTVRRRPSIVRAPPGIAFARSPKRACRRAAMPIRRVPASNRPMRL